GASTAAAVTVIRQLRLFQADLAASHPSPSSPHHTEAGGGEGGGHVAASNPRQLLSQLLRRHPELGEKRTHGRGERGD
ncbi:MAG: hypothetical protein SGPRY_008683, partial [Prymnesium sp.]